VFIFFIAGFLDGTMDIKGKLNERWRKVKDGFKLPRLRIALGVALFAYPAYWLITRQAQFTVPDEYKYYACLVFFLYAMIRVFIRPQTWTERPWLIILLAVTAFSTIQKTDGESFRLLYERDVIRTWNVYHYYMGSKYFDELGYLDLYTHTMLADQETTHKLEHINKLRDLTDYRTKRLSELMPEKKNREFTSLRWRGFQRDLRALLPKATRHHWKNMLVDRGYNATPFGNEYISRLTNRYSIADYKERLFLIELDLWAYLICFVALWWAFGLEASILTAVTIVLFPFNDGRMVGGMMQYDWLAALVLGVCFLHKKWPIPAAIFLGFGTLMRLFPLVLAAGVALPGVRTWWREKHIDRFYVKFFAALVLVGLVGIWFGAQNKRGFNSWLEWRDEIKVHNFEHTFGGRRVGLKHYFTNPLFKNTEGKDLHKKRVLRAQKPYYLAAATFFVLIFVAAVWRRRPFNAMLMSMMVIFALLVSSRYYWSMLALFLLWERDTEEPGWHPSFWQVVLIFTMAIAYYDYAPTQADYYYHYLFIDRNLALGLLAMAGVQMVRDAYALGWLNLPIQAFRGRVDRIAPRWVQAKLPEPQTPENLPTPEA
jgi:hypothetical protein